MDLHQIKLLPSKRKKRKRVGRGESSGHGKTSGRGHHGYKSRSGSTGRRWYQGGETPLFRRIPKRGFSNAPFRKEYAIVNVGELERFPEGSEVTPELLLNERLIRKLKDGVKILGEGELTKPLTVRAHKFSKQAVEKIESVGGSAVELGK